MASEYSDGCKRKLNIQLKLILGKNYTSYTNFRLNGGNHILLDGITRDHEMHEIQG